jgi:hypothetical protein
MLPRQYIWRDNVIGATTLFGRAGGADATKGPDPQIF